MKTEKKEINIQIGKRLQTARENSGFMRNDSDVMRIKDIRRKVLQRRWMEG